MKGRPRMLLSTTTSLLLLLGFSTTSALSQSHDGALEKVLGIPRGGGLWSRSTKSNPSDYVRALDDEILWLEQQLRRVHDERRILKRRTKQSNGNRRPQTKEDPKQSNSREEEGRRETERDEEFLRLANLERLEAQKDSLLRAKAHLEALKAKCDRQMKAIESALVSSKGQRKDLEGSLQAKVRELQASLDKAATAAAVSDAEQDNNPDLTKAIRTACDKAIESFWEQAQERLRKHEEELRAMQLEELEQERKSAKEAVKKQKDKMRALARATAIREKELWERNKQRRDRRNHSSRVVEKSQLEQDEKERLKAIREEAERKSKFEEEQLWLELERGLQEEREKLDRQRKRAEEERKRCEQEELERQRILQQHAMDMASAEKERQRQQASDAKDQQADSPRFGWWSDLQRFFGFGKPASTKSSSSSNPAIPQTSPIENFRPNVPWQPIALPPKEIIRISQS